MITADDVEFHEWPEGDHTFAETNWFAFYVPEAKINTIVYTVARKALNVQSSDISMYGALVDNRAESLYLDSQMALPAPASLADYTTANGLSIKAVKPPRDYRIDYVGYDDCEVHLDFEGLMEPFDTSDPNHSPHAVSDETAHVAGTGMGEAYKGHFELTGHFTGTLKYRGTEYEVDCVETMDHSWGSRPEIHQHSMGWSHAHFGRDFAIKWINHWHLDKPLEEQQPLAHGYVMQDGEVYGLTDMTLYTHRVGSMITAMDLKVTDKRGKTFELRGSAEVGGPWVCYTASLVYGAQMNWTERTTGRQGYGFASEIRSMQDMTRMHGRRWNQSSGHLTA